MVHQLTCCICGSKTSGFSYGFSLCTMRLLYLPKASIPKFSPGYVTGIGFRDETDFDFIRSLKSSSILR